MPTKRPILPTPERNRQILEMRNQGVSQTEVARRFNLSPSKIYLIEKQDAADRSLAKRRNRLREEIRAADDLERMWPVEDLIDTVDLIVVTKKGCWIILWQPGIRDWFALLVVVVCIVVAALLFRGVWHHKPTLAVNLRQFEAQKAALEDELLRAKTHLINAEDKLKDAVDPGQRPSWYRHPLDWWAWDAKKRAHDEAQELVNQLEKQVAVVKEKIFNWKPETLDILLTPFAWTWNNLISPILHFFLALTLVGLSVRVLLRYLLMGGKIGMVRV